LRPEVLDHLGLASALSNLARAFARRTSIAVERRIDPQLAQLDPNIELVLYRIAQESLTNVARHSEATQVLLALSRETETVVLRIATMAMASTPPTSKVAGCAGSVRTP
jgi:two-component system sensor histidine kinase UhpB